MMTMDLLKREVERMMADDPAHDFEHVMRVYRNAQRMCRKEGADERLVLSAALLHDIVTYPKSDRRSKTSSAESAEKSREILGRHGFADGEIAIVYDAIRDHSFSQNRIPRTIEGRILQDADRLDALGAIGIARVFATGGLMRRPLYRVDDPFCRDRVPDDTSWTVDHFFQKLLRLESLMNTESGRAEARRRTRILEEYLGNLEREV